MAGEGAADVRQVMDRVFFNALLIVQGVVLGYGATVLVQLLRRGSPWASGQEAAVYIAWVASMLFATLALVSQSFGSHLTPLHPTTRVILLTLGLAITEFVGFGILEPRAGEPATIRPWLLAVAAQTFAAFLFVSTVLYYAKPHHHPETDLHPDLERLVRQDQVAAGMLSSFALLCWGALDLAGIDDGLTWPVPLIIGIVVFAALAQQQAKLRVGS